MHASWYGRTLACLACMKRKPLYKEAIGNPCVLYTLGGWWFALYKDGIKSKQVEFKDLLVKANMRALSSPSQKKKSNVNNEEREREDHCGSHVPNCHPPNRRTVPTRPNKTKKISPQKKSFLFVSFFISSDKLASRFFFFLHRQRRAPHGKTVFSYNFFLLIKETRTRC